MTYHIYLGYDPREHEVFLTAKHSLEKRSSVPVQVHRLDQRDLRDSGLFTREYKVDKSGQTIDLGDNRPFSTQFTFTRFLVPELWKMEDSNKSPLTMFVDSDFIWLDDIGKMFKEIEEKKIRSQSKSPVYCVQHDYKPDSSKKMDGMSQSSYNMKLWAAMMVFDMDHPDNENLTPDLVNNASGRDLMNFCWVKDVMSLGDIKERWHFVPSHSEKNTDDPIAAIHYTEGSPNFTGYRNCRYADLWKKEYNDYLKSRILHVDFDLNSIMDGT